jgi:hypothetical protein
MPGLTATSEAGLSAQLQTGQGIPQARIGAARLIYLTPNRLLADRLIAIGAAVCSRYFVDFTIEFSHTEFHIDNLHLLHYLTRFRVMIDAVISQISL